MVISDLKSFDILHCTGRGIVPRLIMAATRSKVSHTALFLQINGEAYILDAQKDGVNLRTFASWQKKYNYSFYATRPILLHESIERTMWSRVHELTGVTGYDFASLLIRQPFRLITGKWRDKGAKEDERMYCSEAVAKVYGWEDSERLSPHDIAMRVHRLGHKLIGKWDGQNNN